MVHWPSQLACGQGAVVFGIWKNRILVFKATGNSSFISFRPDRPLISILLCPEQIHTSPIMILVNTILFLPFIVIVKGPPAAGVSTIISHCALLEPMHAYVF